LRYERELLVNRITKGQKRKVPNDNPTDNNDARGGDEPASDYADIAKSIEALGCKYETAQESQSDHDQKTLFWNRLTGWGVFIYTGLTFFIMIASIFSAVYSRRQADTAEQGLVAVQRAFITVSELKIEPASSRDGKYKFVRVTPVIKNSGPTPAIGVSLVVVTPFTDMAAKPAQLTPYGFRFLSWKLKSPRDPDELIESSSAAMFLRKNFTIGPQGGVTASELTTDMTAQNGVDAQENKIGRFIYGSIRYFDIFNAPHVSKFCFMTDGIHGITTASEDIELNQDLCAHWNCTDKYCGQDKAAYEDEFRKAFAEATEGESHPPQLPPAPSIK
jgi:hypothetical protein